MRKGLNDIVELKVATWDGATGTAAIRACCIAAVLPGKQRESGPTCWITLTGGINLEAEHDAAQVRELLGWTTPSTMDITPSGDADLGSKVAAYFRAQGPQPAPGPNTEACNFAFPAFSSWDTVTVRRCIWPAGHGGRQHQAADGVLYTEPEPSLGNFMGITGDQSRESQAAPAAVAIALEPPPPALLTETFRSEMGNTIVERTRDPELGPRHPGDRWHFDGREYDVVDSVMDTDRTSLITTVRRYYPKNKGKR